MSARVLWTLATISFALWSTPGVTSQSTARHPVDACGDEPLELRLMDSVDRLREQVARQEDTIRSLRCPQEKCHYDVFVTTGTNTFDDTSQSVEVRLYHGQDSTSWILLENPDKTKFRLGKTDHFSFSDICIDDPCLVVRHAVGFETATGREIDHWHLIGVQLERSGGGRHWIGVYQFNHYFLSKQRTICL